MLRFAWSEVENPPFDTRNLITIHFLCRLLCSNTRQRKRKRNGSRSVTGNTILNALPDEAFGRIVSDSTLVSERSCTAPRSDITCLLPRTRDGLDRRIYRARPGNRGAVIGSEGRSDSIVLGAESTPYENIVQLANGGLRIRSGRRWNSNEAGSPRNYCCNLRKNFRSD